MLRYTLIELFCVPAFLLVFHQTSDARNRNERVYNFIASHNTRNYNKCAFHIYASYYSSFDADPGLKSILEERPYNDTSIVSPSGRFRIHFDTSGTGEPFMYDSSGQPIPSSTMAFVDSVAAICDYVYAFEVDSLGFPPPPSDSGAGGGFEYDVYIQDLPLGEYGATVWDDSHPLISRPNPTYAAWMMIRNEFESTYTKGIQAMEVTIAHEFHHGIQVGNYGLWSSQIYFYELTSVWMEQEVYPEVKDYYQYLPNFFSNVDLPFNEYNQNTYAGYERCVFGIFVQHAYGASIMKGIWENIAHEPVIQAIKDEFTAIGLNPNAAFQTFTDWNYFTGYRADAARQYDLQTYPAAADYPLAKVSGTGELTSSGVEFSDEARSLSEHFYRINDGPDTIGLALSNSNYVAAANSDSASFQFSVGIGVGGQNCIRQLSSGYCVTFAAADYPNWGIVPFIPGTALTARNNLPFPQPFDPSSQSVKIPYPFSDTGNVTLSIYSVSGDLIYKLSGDQAVVSYLRGRYCVWDGKNNLGRTVSSGVYFYVISDGSKNSMGKLAVVRMR